MPALMRLLFRGFSSCGFPLVTVLVQYFFCGFRIFHHQNIALNFAQVRISVSKMSSTEGRITELLVPFLEGSALSNAQLESLYAYLDLLLKWNSKMNLTAVRNPEEIVTRH